MLLLDHKKGVAKKTIKKVFFATPFLREGKGEKKREARCQKTFLHCFWGLKNGQEVVPPFWAPKFQFFKSAEAPIFKTFPGKVGGCHLGGKGYVGFGQKNKK